MYSPLQLHQEAQSRYEHALGKARQRQLVSFVLRRDNELLSLDAIMQRLHLRGQHSLGLVTVCLDEIIGTAGRTDDFDRAFFPRRTVTQGRWLGIIKMMILGESLPPVELRKVGDAYFVIDGHHRISAARQTGQEYIDAFVTEIDAPEEELCELGMCGA
jgi:hypothetical protein